MSNTVQQRKANAVSAKALKQLALGVSRLVDGQRLFAEEFGLPYSRIFHDGFEAFKDRPVEAVIRDWVSAEQEDSGAIEKLFSDLLAHQLSLVESLEELAQQSQQANSASPVLRFFRGGSKQKNQGMHQHYMEVVAPKFVLAYTRARHNKNVVADGK